MKILRHNSNGFVYYEAIAQGMNLSAFKITELVLQLWDIYAIDLRQALFSRGNKKITVN